MNFLSWGDFNIPFTWGAYWAKHFYMWSFQSGTPNPDGLIRLPGRVLNFLVFGATNDVVTGYFYLFSSLAVAYIAFFLFARKFLQIKKTSVVVLGSLFFALNPIFLGNLAKVGLVLAAAMLPFCLLAIRTTFVRRQFRFFLLFIVCLNISFLHPYTFTVNVLASGGYLLWMAWQHCSWVRDVWLKFALCGVFAIALNMYFALPMATMGTVSKDVISTNITPVAVDYTALVGISNTHDLFTGFSLSKNVFVDFSFYNSIYQNVYFFGVFVFYVLLFGLYLLNEKRLGLHDKRRLGVAFAAFLVLLLLAATTVAHVDTIIKVLISMPGGWAFRSPLKWQLYIPLALYTILVILLNRVQGKGKLFAFEAGLVATFVIMNGYLALDIGYKLLTPRKPTYFAALNNMNMDNKTVLLVNNGACMDFMRTYPKITTELNQIFGSKNTQLKHVLEDSVDSVNLGSYDYVLGCADALGQTLTEQYNFKPVGAYANNIFHLYANQLPPPAVGATVSVFQLPAATNMANKYQFATSNFGDDFWFTSSTLPAHKLSDAFETVGPKNIQDGAMSVNLRGDAAQPTALFVWGGNGPLYYNFGDGQRILSKTPMPNLLPAKTDALPMPSAETYTLTYKDSAIKAKNLIANGDFTKELWQPGVTDCYSYDDQPAITMKRVSQGGGALELSAKSHIACTGPDAVAVKPDQHYIVSFDYQSLGGGKFAGMYAGFDDPNNTTVLERMQNKDDAWHSFSKEITVPGGATHVRLLLYAYPDSYGQLWHTARYDNVRLQRIPPAQDRFYVMQPNAGLKLPQKLSYKIVDPTRKTARITGATKPFYLTTNETYNPLWQARLGSSPIAKTNHVALNETMNGWYIDPAKLCANGGCSKQQNGSYDFDLSMTFTPQQWFYRGALISAAAAILGTAYFFYERRRDESVEGRWLWHK